MNSCLNLYSVKNPIDFTDKSGLFLRFQNIGLFLKKKITFPLADLKEGMRGNRPPPLSCQKGYLFHFM